MACLEGLPVVRKAGRPGCGRGHGRGARTGVRSLHVPWGTRGPARASPRARCFPAPLGLSCVHSAGEPHGRETDEASAAGGPVHGVRAASRARADRRRGTGRLAADRRGDPSGPGRRRGCRRVRRCCRRLHCHPHRFRPDRGTGRSGPAHGGAPLAPGPGHGTAPAPQRPDRAAGSRRARSAPLATGRRWGETATAAGRRPSGGAMVVAGAKGPPGQARAADRRRGGRQHRGGLGSRPTAGHARPDHRGTDLAGRDGPPRPGPSGMTASCRARVPAGSGCRSAGSAPAAAPWTWTRTAAPPAR
jgi:hypothetical protein